MSFTHTASVQHTDKTTRAGAFPDRRQLPVQDRADHADGRPGRQHQRGQRWKFPSDGTNEAIAYKTRSITPPQVPSSRLSAPMNPLALRVVKRALAEGAQFDPVSAFDEMAELHRLAEEMRKPPIRERLDAWTRPLRSGMSGCGACRSRPRSGCNGLGDCSR